jgi:hypothetical protein
MKTLMKSFACGDSCRPVACSFLDAVLPDRDLGMMPKGNALLEPNSEFGQRFAG